MTQDQNTEARDIAARIDHACAAAERRLGSMDAVCEAAGLRRGWLNWYRQGGREPTLSHASRIADATGVTLEWLATGRGPREEISRGPTQRQAATAFVWGAPEVDADTAAELVENGVLP